MGTSSFADDQAQDAAAGRPGKLWQMVRCGIAIRHPEHNQKLWTVSTA
jgi:predicted ArsR family transcriptional regulator